MDILSCLSLNENQKSHFIVAIDACELPVEKFKKKYRPQLIKITQICDTVNKHIPELMKTRQGRNVGSKILTGLDKILYIRSEYLNNELQSINDRFTIKFDTERKRNTSKSDSKDKRRKIKVKEEENNDDDDESVIIVSQPIDFDLKKDFEVDINVKDKNLIDEIVPLNEDENIATASYFGPASKEEIEFTWDNVDDIPNLNKSKTTHKEKYGIFARAEQQVLEELNQSTTRLPLEVQSNNEINDDGNFVNFTERMRDALPKIPLTPSKRKQINDRSDVETPSKRNRMEHEVSNNVEALPDNDEGNFADFSQRIEEALPEIPSTPSKRKSVSDNDLIETPSKRSRKSLNKKLQDSEKEPDDDDVWILPDIEEFDNTVKKTNKKTKKKKNKFLDEKKTISLSVDNIQVGTVPVEERRVPLKHIVTTVHEHFRMPSSLFAGNKKFKPISRVLLARFQNTIDNLSSPQERNNELAINNSNFQLPSLVDENISQLRVPVSVNTLGISSVKAEPVQDFPPLEEARNDPEEATEPPVVLDSKIEEDEDLLAGEHTTERPPDVTELVNLPPTEADSLGQLRDTVPIEELNGDFTDTHDRNDPNDPDWSKEYVYQRIKQLCEGGVRITFEDLAPMPETKKMNRILAFEFILKLGSDEKICMDEIVETETINIWLPDNPEE